TFVPYKRSGFAVKAPGMQQLDEVQLQFDLVNPKKQFVSLVSNSKDVFALERTQNFDRVYGLSERWKVEIPDIYNEVKDTISGNLKPRGEAFTNENIERQLQIQLELYK